MTERTCPIPPREMVELREKRKRRAEVSRKRMAARGVPSVKQAARQQEAQNRDHPSRPSR